MNLRDIALSDNKKIYNDSAGFGWDVTITSPEGVTSATLKAFTNDISQIIDPDTGVAVSGRFISVSMHIPDIINAGYSDLPKNIPNTASKPWIIQFTDILGNTGTYKVKRSIPDYTLGTLSLVLEIYKL